MDPKALEDLEFHKIREILAREADGPLGREKALAAVPVGIEEARVLREPARELADILARTSAPSLRGLSDVRPRLTAAAQGSVLSAADLGRVLAVLQGCDTLAVWLADVPDIYRALVGLRERLPRLPSLTKRLGEIVDPDGGVKDGASPELASIRRRYREYQEQLRKRAEELTRRRDVAQYLQEPIVTVRNGRYVLPVKQEHAARVPGLVHDQSATGQTLFVEPQELLDMANNLRRLELMERDEIERILAEASSMVGEHAGPAARGVEALADFDLSLAKARLAFRWRGSFPALSGRREIRLVKAWHPLLTGTPVPMDLRLEEGGVRTVVITGPNMGGKTVALKTCGLLTAMALSGMPCPCSDETVVGDFTDVLCDIGDEQSIEENLSTFSAHVSNLVRILKEAGPGKLVLIDELGAGTDPQEGAALALAILKRLNRSGGLSVVTTHFGELKLAAQENPGMENASVEWDAVNLVPTYRLVVGRPGRSNAFLVAKKLGVDEDVLEDARASMNRDVLLLDDIIRDMEASSQRSREEAERLRRERLAAESLKREYEEKVSALECARRETLDAAKKEAAAILTRARTELERTVRELRKADRRDRTAFAETVGRMRGSIRSAREEFLPDDSPDVGEVLPASEAIPGARVGVVGFQGSGVIVEGPGSGDDVMMRLGTVSVRAKLSDLRRLRGPRAEAGDDRSGPPAQTTIPLEKVRDVSREIDLRGMTADEAEAAADKYLDDAMLASIPEVRIIHGKGTGALRKAVAGFLRRDPRIQDFRLGEAGEGGAGVTVAKLQR